MPYSGVRRKLFISYFRSDQREVDPFIHRWATVEGLFIPKVLGAGTNYDLIKSSNPEYVMSRIRRYFLGDSTVTIVMVGSCTHGGRYIDWEIKASFRRGEDDLPNGLIGILLPSQGNAAYLPPRFEQNWNRDQGLLRALVDGANNRPATRRVDRGRIQREGHKGSPNQQSPGDDGVQFELPCPRRDSLINKTRRGCAASP